VNPVQHAETRQPYLRCDTHRKNAVHLARTPFSSEDSRLAPPLLQMVQVRQASWSATADPQVWLARSSQSSTGAIEEGVSTFPRRRRRCPGRSLHPGLLRKTNSAITLDRGRPES